MEHGRFDYSPIVQRPALRMPNDARVALWVTPNVEHFHYDKPAMSLTPMTASLKPDVLNYAWRDYGARVGVWRLMEIFERQGFRKVNEAPFHFSDHEYGAFAADLDVPENAPSVFTDPMVLNRPEDQLDEAGILEKSMERGASNPHAEWADRRHH